MTLVVNANPPLLAKLNAALMLCSSAGRFEHTSPTVLFIVTAVLTTRMMRGTGVDASTHEPLYTTYPLSHSNSQPWTQVKEESPAGGTQSTQTESEVGAHIEAYDPAAHAGVEHGTHRLGVVLKKNPTAQSKRQPSCHTTPSPTLGHGTHCASAVRVHATP